MCLSAPTGMVEAVTYFTLDPVKAKMWQSDKDVFPEWLPFSHAEGKLNLVENILKSVFKAHNDLFQVPRAEPRNIG